MLYKYYPLFLLFHLYQIKGSIIPIYPSIHPLLHSSFLRYPSFPQSIVRTKQRVIVQVEYWNKEMQFCFPRHKYVQLLLNFPSNLLIATFSWWIEMLWKFIKHLQIIWIYHMFDIIPFCKVASTNSCCVVRAVAYWFGIIWMLGISSYGHMVWMLCWPQNCTMCWYRGYHIGKVLVGLQLNWIVPNQLKLGSLRSLFGLIQKPNGPSPNMILGSLV